ncbi:Hypothetical protein I5071_85260 [Sandaracinus amylolyticus]|nr:Hypothetical protein I5071_85260 [Sandaracinus amylolyticus]
MRSIHIALVISLLALIGGCTVGEPSDPDAGGQADATSTGDAGAPDAARVECGSRGDTVGEACGSSTECDDGCFCNGIEQCVSGACVRRDAPCVDELDCTGDLCDEDTDTCDPAPDDAACADTDMCNGAEVCVPGVGCVPGPRLVCNDDDPCTIGTCDPETGCAYIARDLDGDGHADDRCGGDDCNDDPSIGATVHPGGTEVCDNGLDDDCNRVTDYYELACRATNDDCARAEMLPGPGTYVRTTRGATNHYPLSCFAGGIDTVFRFHLDEPRDVSASLRIETSGTGALAIRAADRCADGPDVACGNAVATRALPAGDHVLVVRTSSAVTFTLSLSFDAPSAEEDTDVCGPATVDISGGGVFTGLFAEVEDDYEVACNGGAPTRDAAYRMVLTEPSDVQLSASTSTGAPVTTYLTLTRDCDNELGAIGCATSGSPQLFRQSLPAGTYYVLIESASATALTWRLEATITPAAVREPGDACTAPLDVTNRSATVPISELSLDTGTGCGGDTAAFRDATFSFTTTEVQDVILTTETGGPHYASLSPLCGDRAAETFCSSGSPRVTQRLLRVPAGTHYVTVATTQLTGDVTASAMLAPPTFPPANDECGGAIDLTDSVLSRGDLTAASDDVLSCGGNGAVETVHRLVLTQERAVTFVARRSGSTEPLAIGVREAGTCTVRSSDAPCGFGMPAVISTTLRAGTYFVVVEAPTAPGPYSLIAYLAEP